jgi:hypothetical protein
MQAMMLAAVLLASSAATAETMVITAARMLHVASGRMIERPIIRALAGDQTRDVGVLTGGVLGGGVRGNGKRVMKGGSIVTGAR